MGFGGGPTLEKLYLETNLSGMWYLTISYYA